MNQLGDMDQLEQMMSTASNPGALAEVDIERAAELLGPDAARSLEQLAKLARQLAEAGLIDQRRAGSSSPRVGCGRSVRTPCPTSFPS